MTIQLSDEEHRFCALRCVRGGQDDGRAHRAGGVRVRRGHGARRGRSLSDVPRRAIQGHEHRLMKPEESYSARDTLCRLEEELINLEEHPLFLIESLRHRLPHPRVWNL